MPKDDIQTYEMTLKDTAARMQMRRVLTDAGAQHVETLEGQRLQAEMTPTQAASVKQVYGSVLLDFHPVVNVIAMAQGTGPLAKPPTLAELGVVAPDKSKLN
ncbi:MAG: hypothetical protein EON60_02990 [Alphaproteobacteria bacterium]|nr:MAG: hypothetical protein EON60_02990 [Alphaproteobacteria bacterium]